MYYPQNFINKFYYNEEYPITNLIEFYNYLKYVHEYKKILFNVDNYKIISRCFFHLCSITQITSDEINNLDNILKFFEAEKIFKDIFNNYKGDLTENMALFFVLVLENKNISNDIEEVILSFFEGFSICKIFKYCKDNYRTNLYLFQILNPILINNKISPGYIGQLDLANYPLTNLRKCISSNNIKKIDILNMAITFLKSAKDGNIPFCIFEILDHSNDWLDIIEELKKKNINKLTSSLYPYYINQKSDTIIRIKRSIFSLYENIDFEKLNELNIFNILKNKN
jgi:hypothetical protein